MVIDLSDFNFREPPILILRNPDGTPIGVLGTAYNIALDLHYNEVSTLSFTLSAYDKVQRTQFYPDVIGLRIVELKGIGQFVLNNPKITSQGTWEVKECTAYSLEREFVRKNVFFEKNVYNFWNPIAPEETVLGILLEKFPNWSVGSVDDGLVGKYRSLEETDDNAYNVMKGTLQDAYGCIFDFDTYKRQVNVVSAEQDPFALPVFLSLRNLIKELQIEEDDESIATCLGVYGASGLNIADVNPLGGSKIYNFDYFMTDKNFTAAEIQAYQSWKNHFKAMQEPFYNLTVEQALKESQIAAESARLTDLQGELRTLEGVQSTWVELLASHSYSGLTMEDGTPADEAKVVAKLADIYAQIQAKQGEIDAQKAVVEAARQKSEQLQAERQDIVNGCQFEVFFSAEEISKLDHYIHENTIEESSFVASEVKNYQATDLSSIVTDATVTLMGNYANFGPVSFDALPLASVEEPNSVYCIASGEKHYWDTSLTRMITPSLTAEATYISQRNGAVTVADLSDEFSAFLTAARNLYVEDEQAQVVEDDSPASILYLAKGVLSVGTRAESLNAVTYFMTTEDFVEGAGTIYPAGVSVVVRNINGRRKYDVLPDTFHISEHAAMTVVEREGGDLYSSSGGRVVLSDNEVTISAQEIRTSVEVRDDCSFTLSSYLSAGTVGAQSFPGGTLVLTGTCRDADGDMRPGENGTLLVLDVAEARLYFTQNMTEWERRSVAWDLFQYGQEVLEKVSQPSYSFSVDAADFLVMEEFEAFRKALVMGKRCYLELENGRVLSPLLIGLKHSFNESDSLGLEFSSKYTSSDQSFRLVDLLEDSVSMGQKLNVSRNLYEAFINSGANAVVNDLLTGPLDVSKNMVTSSTDQAMTWDENGLRLRKRTEDGTGYFPEQVWMVHNNICFTDDAWQTAKMALGHFQDSNIKDANGDPIDLWGLVAPNIVGTLLAGRQLYILGTDARGETTLFRVDGQGVYSYNSRQYWEGTNGGAIGVDPKYGLMLGTSAPFVSMEDGSVRPRCIDEEGKLKLDKDEFPEGMNVWMGIDGRVYIRGHLVAESGKFTGDVYADNFYFNDGDNVRTLLDQKNKKISSDWLDLMGLNVVDAAGNVMMTIDNEKGITIKKGSISWSNISNAPSIPYVPGYIRATHIDMSGLQTPKIVTNMLELQVPRIMNAEKYGLRLTGYYENRPDPVEILRIYYESNNWETNAPVVHFSPSDFGAYASWDFGVTTFHGHVDFSSANVEGVHATFA